MAEPKPEQILAAIKTRLAAIVGDSGVNYWYTPTAVARIDNWAAWEPEWFDQGNYTTVYLIRGGDETVIEHVDFSIDRELEYFILGGTKFDTSTLNPFSQTGTISQTVQNRLIADVQKKIWSDVTLGGLGGIINNEVTDVGRMTPMVEGWAVVQFRLKCLFNTPHTTP